MLVEEMIKITTAVGGFTFPNGATATQQDGTADKNPSDNTHNTAPRTASIQPKPQASRQQG
jgi:hypothetical protein